MCDDYCGGDTGYSNDDNYTCNDNTTYYDTITSNQDVVYSTNVIIDDSPVIGSDNFHIGGCQTIYDGAFQTAPINNVGFESISIGGGVQPCYDADFHTIAVGTIDPCYVAPQVYPDYTVPTSAYIFMCFVFSGMLVIFIVMGKCQYTIMYFYVQFIKSFLISRSFCNFSSTLHLFINNVPFIGIYQCLTKTN